MKKRARVYSGALTEAEERERERERERGGGGQEFPD